VGLLACVADAAEPEPLDEEFLEYLAEFEDNTDNWTWFASDDEKEAAPKSPVKPTVEPTARPTVRPTAGPPVKHEEKVEP
jgi:hypothetical protein